MFLNLTLTDMRLESFHLYRVSLHVYGLSFGPLCNICFNKRNQKQVVPVEYSCLFHVYNIHCCFILQPYCSVLANKSTVEHDFYKLTTIKLLHSNHCHSQARRHVATANNVEWSRRRSLSCNMSLCCGQSVDSNEVILKVTSLFECHLNIDPVSSFE